MKPLLIFLFAATATFAQTPEWSRKYHTGSVTCLDFSSDGGKLLSGSDDQTIRLWDLSKGDSIRTFKSIKARIDNVDFNITGENFIVSYLLGDREGAFKTSILTTNQDSILRVIENSMTAAVQYSGGPTFDFDNAYHNFSYFFQNDSSIVNMASSKFRIGPGASNEGWISSENLYTSKQQLLFYNLGRFTVRCVSKDKMKTFGGGAWDWVRPSGGGGPVYSGEGTTYQYIDFITGIINKISYNPTIVRAVTFSSDEKSVLTALSNGNIYIGKIPQCKIVDSLGTLDLQTSLATALAADIKGYFYISAHADSTLRLWTPGIPNIFKRIQLQSPVTMIGVSPDSVRFATAHTDGTVAVWNIDSLAKYTLSDSVFTPSITAISGNQTVCEGTGVVLTASAKSNFGEKLFYQWRKGGVDLQPNDSVINVNASALILQNVDKADNGQYSVVVTSEKGGQIISQNIVLHVLSEPVIVEQPKRNYIRKDITTYLKFTLVLADPTGIRYQWYKNGNVIPGATHGHFEFEFSEFDTISHTGEYYVVVTNDCGSEKSKTMSVGNIVSVKENPFKNIPLSAEPNPFKSSTTIHFSLPKALKVKLAVTDILGKEIAVLKDEFTEMGEQSVVFKNEHLPDGMYYITLSGEGLLKTIPAQITR